MTGFQKLFGKAITISAALSMTAGLALAADGTVSADRIVNALQPKPLTRGLSWTASRSGHQGKRDRLRQDAAQPQHQVAIAGRA